jgi:hypothetical protein
MAPSDFSTYTATQVANWMSQGTVETPPGSLWVTLYDDTGTELDGSLQNGRVQTDTSTDWDVVNTNDFTNNGEIDFGEATTDITIQEVALFDSDTGGSNNEIARYEISTAPDTRNSGTRIFFQAGDLTFDVLDRTE